MPIVYLALGTNLGDRAENLRQAIERLGAQVKLTARSKIYETEPWGVTDQPRFLNQVVMGEIRLDAPGLLRFLKGIEQDLGRTPDIRYGPRVIDLDILFYDHDIIRTPDLIVPHPRLAERRFVLVPLAGLAPGFIHPELGMPIQDLLARLPDDASVQPYAER